jgi:hypothetical protein
MAGYLTYLAQKAKEEGTEDQLPAMPKDLDEEETTRLAILSPTAGATAPITVLVYYIFVHMPVGISEEEAVMIALDATRAMPLPSPPPRSPWD